MRRLGTRTSLRYARLTLKEVGFQGAGIQRARSCRSRCHRHRDGREDRCAKSYQQDIDGIRTGSLIPTSSSTSKTWRGCMLAWRSPISSSTGRVDLSHAMCRWSLHLQRIHVIKAAPLLPQLVLWWAWRVSVGNLSP